MDPKNILCSLVLHMPTLDYPTYQDHISPWPHILIKVPKISSISLQRGELHHSYLVRQLYPGFFYYFGSKIGLAWLVFFLFFAFVLHLIFHKLRNNNQLKGNISFVQGNMPAVPKGEICEQQNMFLMSQVPIASVGLKTSCLCASSSLSVWKVYDLQRQICVSYNVAENTNPLKSNKWSSYLRPSCMGCF